MTVMNSLLPSSSQAAYVVVETARKRLRALILIVGVIRGLPEVIELFMRQL
jgi:hypothetical protein